MTNRSAPAGFSTRIAALAMAVILASSALVPGARAEGSDRSVAEALVWLGLSERVPRARLDARDRRAILQAERRLGLAPDGRLDRGERRILLEAAAQRRASEGYRVVRDEATGARVGVPFAWMGRARPTERGTRWASPDGAITVETFARRGTLAGLERRERSRPGARITYDARGRDWLVLSGFRNRRLLYLRVAERDGEMRGIRVAYDPALRDRLDRIVVAMSGDFRPFAGHASPDALDGRDAAPLIEGPLASLPSLPRVAPEPRARTALPRVITPDGVLDPDEPAFGPERERETASIGRPEDFAPIPPLEGPTERDDDAPDPRILEDLPETRPGEPDIGDPGIATEETIDENASEAPVPREITGLLTDEGQSCPTLRGPDGTLYALVGEVPSVRPGTLVTIEAVEVDTTRCSAGRPVAVGAFRVRVTR